MDFSKLDDMVHGFEYLILAWCHPNDIYHFNDFYPCYLRYFLLILAHIQLTKYRNCHYNLALDTYSEMVHK